MAELRTFVFTDIRGSVDLKDQMPGRNVAERDVAFVEQVLVPHRFRIEKSLAQHGGRVVSTAGDGHFLVFLDAISAAQWSIEVQKSHQADPIATPGNKRVEVRISMHVGAPQIDPSSPDNFIGKSVDYAARLNDYANGDQILVSRSVMAILDDVGLEGVQFYLHGRYQLKGVGQVEIHELLYDGRQPREMRQKPKSHSHRFWTVVPTEGFHDARTPGNPRQLGSSVASPPISRVGNYVLEERIGSGGMGDVYRARHTQFDRVRAIKVIKPELVANGNPEVIRRFYHEIKTVGALEHRNIVVAIDSSSSTDPIHYLVMEFIDGVALNDLVDQHGPLDVPDAAELVLQAAQGLQFIHQSGLVHRDIKPSNLMLQLVDADAPGSSSSKPGSVPPGSRRGVVKIFDLGLALLTDNDHERLTQFDNKALGTAMYMSPEQWKTTSVDIRSDIYSLGCTLYHLLAGNPPFADSDLKPEKAHEKIPVPPIPGLPRDLWQVLQKMMAKSPDERYETPAEVVLALEPFTPGHDLVKLVREYRANSAAPQAELRTQTSRSSRADTRPTGKRASRTRRQLLWSLPATAALVALIGLGYFLQQRHVEKDLAAAEREARDQLPRLASFAANRTLGTEIAQRFEILTTAANDPLLRQQLAKINASPGDRSLWEPLADWLLKLNHTNQERAKADSWFITDAHGTQVARTPASDSIGKNFAYRDYFHGQGPELKQQDAEKIAPIQRPTKSAVFKSTSTDRFKMAFSVPIWSDEATADRTVLGVLALSIDLGQFTVLENELWRGGRDQVVLVDLREDYLHSGDQRNGLILQHPMLSSWWSEGDIKRPPRIDPKLLDAMKPGQGGFVAGYSDPMPVNRGKRFWGAFEPVAGTFDRDSTSHHAPGWMVLVQRPMPD